MAGTFMKCLFGLLFLLPTACAVYAQSPAAPTVRGISNAPAAAEAPSSNIDLLRQSLSASQAAAPAGASASAAQSAASAAAQQAAKPAVNVSKDNLLEMPLDIGGGQVVTTQVAPVKKTVSPKAAQRVAASKAKRTQAARQKARTVKPTPVERDIEKSNALLPKTQTEPGVLEVPVPDDEDAAADAELEYAARMLRESRESAAGQSGRTIPPPAAKNTARTVPAPNKAFNPGEFRPGVNWLKSDSTHFTIYTQKRDNGISSSNMAMTFESAYQTLRRFIPWMMSGKVRVFVYQDYQSYLKHEPQAKAWTRALAYPTRGEIVVYDEPGKTQELKETFTHELTHIFTQQFFDKHKSGRIMTPTWLDEGLAVMMEDQAYNGMKGGPWNNDLKTVNFQRDPSTEVAVFGSSSMFGGVKQFKAVSNGKPLYFMPFDRFMQENSLSVLEGQGKTQDWYFQAYAMVRFLLNPSGSSSPSNRMQFEQFTRLLAEGEPVRNPSTGFLVKDKRGRTVYQPYSAEKAMGRAFRYASTANFEDNFWRWADTVKTR